MAKWSSIWSQPGLTRAQKELLVQQAADPTGMKRNYQRPAVRSFVRPTDAWYRAKIMAADNEPSVIGVGVAAPITGTIKKPVIERKKPKVKFKDVPKSKYQQKKEARRSKQQ